MARSIPSKIKDSMAEESSDEEGKGLGFKI